jgi:hypothetical protein
VAAEHAAEAGGGRRTVSDEVGEHICCLGLRDDAVRRHLVQYRLGAQHGKQRVGVDVVWAGGIQRCLRRGAPVIKPGNLQSARDDGMATAAAEQLTGFQWS